MQVLNFTVEIEDVWSEEHEQTIYTGLVKLGDVVVFRHDLNYVFLRGEAEAETTAAFVNALAASLKPWQVLQS